VTLRAVVVDLPSYRSVQGSSDAVLLEQVCAQAEEKIAAEDAWFTRLRPDHLPIAMALRDIVMGTLRDGKSAALSYQVAALVLAEHLGERIDDEAIAERSPDVQVAIDKAISELLVEYGRAADDWPLLADVLTRGPALDIPWVQETLPNGTGVLAECEVRRAAQTVAGIALQEHDDARELAMVYGGWLTLASEASLALLLACE
jgi:hypothetical protein